MNFGRALRHHWLLEEGIAFLNHGSFGAAPRPVLEAQDGWRQKMERQPVRFMVRELPEVLRAAAAQLATFVGAKGSGDLVFVDNATTGINAVVRSLAFKAGEQILTTNHGYGAVRQTLRYVCEQTGAELVEVDVPYPLKDSGQIVAALEAGITERTRLAVLDHITSPTALVMPLAELIACCHRHGVWVLVDGAHAPGMIALDLHSLGADWYTGNAHKWLFAPKGCAFLWTRPELQDRIHPTVISHGFGSGYVSEFDWVGTRDPSPWLAVTTALEFVQSLGVAAVRQHNRDLAAWAGQHLADRWQVPLSGGMLGAMTTVPLPENWPGSCLQEATRLHDHLWDRHRIEVPVLPFGGRLWIRISAQVYNEPEEYAHLAEVVAAADPKAVMS